MTPVIDSQVHVYQANTPARPWRSEPAWPAHVTADEMVAALDAAGVDGAILVSPFSLYGYDAGYAVQAQRTHPGRFAVVKPVDPDDPAVDDVVADWKHTPGAVGVRIFMDRTSGRDAGHAGLHRVARVAARHDLPVNLHCWENLVPAGELIDRHPETRFVIDHLGLVQPFAPPAPFQPWIELPTVLELARRPNVAIKVSGACTLAREPYPFLDLWEPLGRVFDAFGFDRCLWGTDWTRALAVVSLAQAVDAFRHPGRLSAGDRAMLMGGACAGIYRWAPALAPSRPRR